MLEPVSIGDELLIASVLTQGQEQFPPCLVNMSTMDVVVQAQTYMGQLLEAEVLGGKEDFPSLEGEEGKDRGTGPSR